MGAFTIIQGKEGNQPKKPLFLVTIVAPDGDTCYLCTSTYYGQQSLTWNGITWLARILKADIANIQAMSPQGYDSVSGFTLTLADADKFLWTNHCHQHGWRGATVTLTAILWDVVANQYSTDQITWQFIGGNPQHDHARGETSVDVIASVNFARLKVPSIPLEYRCPWAFPRTQADRTAALNDPTSPYYQCGYSADISGGVGNLQGDGTPFTTCDYTRSSPTDPSVGCMARLGNSATTSVAPDGDLTHDKAGNYTARFGGVTWLAPAQYAGRQYTSGNKTFGFNSTNTALAGSYYSWVYGTQWVPAAPLAPASDPNSVRFECVPCVAAFGPANVIQVVVNGVVVPQGGADVLFTWRYTTQGGRSGALQGDAIFDKHGDPHGSMCCIEVVVPSQLASPGSIPSCEALVTGPPILNVYAIDNISGGTVTFTGPNYSCAGNPPYSINITGNSNSALNGVWQLSNWTYGPPGTVTLIGTSGSGTGGAAFFHAPPDLWDNGGDIVTNPTGMYNNHSGPAANPVFAYLDLMEWGNISLSQIDPVSWYNAAQIARRTVSYKAADGSTQTHAQFKASFALRGDQRQVLAQALTALRNCANLMVGPNSSTGLIQCFIRQSLADQQPNPIPGSNYNVAVTSLSADGSSAIGYYAYLFDESVIEAGSFRITTTRIESTPNTVSFPFQDEQNGYQQDSLTEIDPEAYTYSGNQQIQVPVPMLGIPNFDQGTRLSNVQLAEALFGNPRNDAGGTLYFEFTVNQRVLHLTGRLGYICGLTWQALKIGVDAPQPIRIVSLKPDTDGERWQVKAAWHWDEWYTYAYGQNPSAFHQNPLLAPPNRPPYPWHPGLIIYGQNDALFPNGLTFALGATQFQISAYGTVPINQQPSIAPALTPLQAETGNAGGSLLPGTYYLAITSNGAVGPLSLLTVAVVPAGTNTNTIIVDHVLWPPSAATAPNLYLGNSVMDMSLQSAGTWTGSNPDLYGNPTTFTITGMTEGLAPAPDQVFSKFMMRQTQILHGGCWGDQVTGVAPGGLQLGFANAAWTPNQWAGHVLSLYYRRGLDGSDVTQAQPGLNVTVISNTSNTLTVSGSGFQVGDVVVMRAKSAHITANTIGDDNFMNSYAPGGLTVNAEHGNLVIIIAGTGAWQAPKAIASNTATVLTLSGTWDINPDSTSIFIVVAPSHMETYSKPVLNDGSLPGAGRVLAAPNPQRVQSTLTQSWLFEVATANANGDTFDMTYQPFREVWLPAISLLGPGYYAITPVNGVATIDLSNGLVQEILLTGTPVTISAPIFTGGQISAGLSFTLYLDQDATGSRAIPTFTGGTLGFASDVGSWQIDGSANTRTSYYFEFSGSAWILTSPVITGGAIS